MPPLDTFASRYARLSPTWDSLCNDNNDIAQNWLTHLFDEVPSVWGNQNNGSETKVVFGNNSLAVTGFDCLTKLLPQFFNGRLQGDPQPFQLGPFPIVPPVDLATAFGDLSLLGLRTISHYSSGVQGAPLSITYEWDANGNPTLNQKRIVQSACGSNDRDTASFTMMFDQMIGGNANGLCFNLPQIFELGREIPYDLAYPANGQQRILRVIAPTVAPANLLVEIEPIGIRDTKVFNLMRYSSRIGAELGMSMATGRMSQTLSSLGNLPAYKELERKVNALNEIASAIRPHMPTQVGMSKGLNELVKSGS